jgi:hypothetical protein
MLVRALKQHDVPDPRTGEMRACFAGQVYDFPESVIRPYVDGGAFEEVVAKAAEPVADKAVKPQADKSAGFVCEVCGREYRRRGDLTRHTNRDH